ncbi:hypothetical protein [Nocardia sp. CA-119907]|uniref:hypothetical protein n=1 Tax=Nocardia sp. CA-119907 TaxID=3239973 RepID=UPI003D98F7E7
MSDDGDGQEEPGLHTGWLQYSDGTWADVDKCGNPGEPITLDDAIALENDFIVAIVAVTQAHSPGHGRAGRMPDH